MTGNEKPQGTHDTAVKPETEAHPEPKKDDENEFHPHRHGHVAIATPETAVTHLDPGAITF